MNCTCRHAQTHVTLWWIGNKLVLGVPLCYPTIVGYETINPSIFLGGDVALPVVIIR